MAARRVFPSLARREAEDQLRGLERHVELGAVADTAWRRPSGVDTISSAQRWSEHVVLALERRQDEIPGALGVGEPVHAQERRALAAAVRRREAGVHAGSQ